MKTSFYAEPEQANSALREQWTTKLKRKEKGTYGVRFIVLASLAQHALYLYTLFQSFFHLSPPLDFYHLPSSIFIAYSAFLLSPFTLFPTSSFIMQKRNFPSSHAYHLWSRQQTSPSHFHVRLIPLLLIAATTLSNLSTPALAQTPAPSPVCCMAFASIDERRLYIQGGLTEVGNKRAPLNQFFSLDLTVGSWSTSDPPWIWPQSFGSIIPPYSSGHSMTAASDSNALFLWDPFQPSAYWSYGTVSHVWGSYGNVLTTTQQSGIKNGIDMNTGTLYVPSGYNNGKEMIINTPGKSTITTSPMPTALMPAPIVHESFLWSTYRNSFLHYGGRAIVGISGNPYLNEYNPNTHEWAAVTTSGPSPGDVSGHSYNGTKMIVFGGASLNGDPNADIHILDILTREWTAGKSADAIQARQYMACAVSGDSFVAWGGESASGIQEATPIVYDMKYNQWTTQFNRVSNGTSTTTGPTRVTSPPTNTAAISGKVPSPPTNTAAIGGGIAGAVVAVVAVVGFLLYRHRRRTRTRKRNGSHQDRDEDEEGVSLAHRQKLPPNNNDDIDAERFEASHPPPLKPRPAEDRHALMSCFSPSSLTELPLAGPHTVPRDPHGQQPLQQFTSTNNGSRSGEVDANNEAHDQVTLLPGPQSNQSDNINIYKGSTGNPRSPRNPQSLNPYEERSQDYVEMNPATRLKYSTRLGEIF
ncbi:hypothetical protein F5H01DRAFT_397646 [Linnemannia elongata]|nr:hypothetical protein F5H01DRAFT_397646 [Linnemannia elongata]